ncbi:hypothetical protein BYT27DRAFT_7189586 [Phlegmacium glaucopus]|nr:hypothetical protein BYT27DRAFT_7189586 [Phlegmacium glaucopus]
MSETNDSLRSDRRLPPPAAKVVTSPPWARDEPPSPKEQVGSTTQGAQSADSRISDTSSLQSNIPPSDSASRWWSFTSRTRQEPFALLPHSPKPEKKSFRDISLSWMSTSSSMREGSTFIRRDKEKGSDALSPHLRSSVPTSAQLPTTVTLSHIDTPGWDTPWTSQPIAQDPFPHFRRGSPYDPEQDLATTNHEHLSEWSWSKKRIRSFILSNAYVPLLFRFINIAFTTAALGMAIQIRKIEIKNNVMGAVGSSPTVVIIFAPLTLVHVMVAIYLEYFGRPLGLWRTSAKLAHTLSEVLFICAWSAALSLCFDNFFTSVVPCASPSSTSWYNQLPRPPSTIPSFEDSLGDRICEHQLSLICLVGVGLAAYCTNLVISLYRVFEKIKYQPTNASVH